LNKNISEDPIGFAGGDANLYRYIFNSPSNGTDRSGHGAVGAFIGGLLGAVLRGTAEGGVGTLIEPGGGTVVGGVHGAIQGAAEGAVIGNYLEEQIKGFLRSKPTSTPIPPESSTTPTPEPTKTPTPSPAPQPKPTPIPAPVPNPNKCKDDCPYEIDDYHIFYPDTRSGSLEGFHSTARTIEGRNAGDYYWVTEPPDDEADYEPFSAEFGIPNQPQWGTKTSSFFPMFLSDTIVLDLIAEAYIKSGCRPSGNWRATVINPLIIQPITITGGANQLLY
jgi:hypothetical protein